MNQRIYIYLSDELYTHLHITKNIQAGRKTDTQNKKEDKQID